MLNIIVEDIFKLTTQTKGFLMAPKTIKIGNVEYVRKQDANEITGDIRIVMLQRGWCAVGRLEQNEHNCILHSASIVRRWGTTNGLGEIAENGPTENTKLDKCNGVLRYHELAAVASIDCEESKWSNVL